MAGDRESRRPAGRLQLWETADGRDRANAGPAMQQARQQIIAATGAQAEFANWEVLEHKTTRRTPQIQLTP